MAPGTYFVYQSHPEGYTDGTSVAGEYGGTISANQISDVEIGTGEQVLRYHFAEYESSSLSGSVFIDNDLDSANDQGDKKPTWGNHDST